MLFLGLYFLCGAVAFICVFARSKGKVEDLLLPIYLLSEPVGWLAWLLWPVALLLFHVDLRERARRAHADAEPSDTSVPAGQSGLVGKNAVTVTRMNPTGIIAIEGQRFEARAIDGFVEPNTPVRVIDQQGSHITVTTTPASL